MLSALCDYADKNLSGIEPGFARKQVKWGLCCDENGRYTGLIDLGEDTRGRWFDKSPVTPNMNSGGKSHFLAETLETVTLFGQQELAEKKDNLKYRRPTKETEKIIVEIVEELLSIEPVGIDDDFFDIGGDSLLATQLIARVNKIFRSEVSIKELFNKPSINGLSIELENYWGSKSTVEEIAKTYREFQSIVNKQ